MRSLLRSCAEVSAAIELSLREVIGVGHGVGVVDGVHVPQAEGAVSGVWRHNSPISLNDVFLYATSKF